MMQLIMLQCPAYRILTIDCSGGLLLCRSVLSCALKGALKMRSFQTAILKNARESESANLTQPHVMTTCINRIMQNTSLFSF